MFASYKRHNNNLYNNLVDLSRNIFFYKKCLLKDCFETRIVIIFIHLSILMLIQKKKNIKLEQEIFDNIFQNIEYGLRELGYGDVYVNKNMKLLNKMFYDILLRIDKNKSNPLNLNIEIVEKYLTQYSELKSQFLSEIKDYFENFHNFCLDLNNNIVLKGQINFKY